MLDTNGRSLDACDAIANNELATAIVDAAAGSGADAAANTGSSGAGGVNDLILIAVGMIEVSNNIDIEKNYIIDFVCVRGLVELRFGGGCGGGVGRNAISLALLRRSWWNNKNITSRW